MLNKSKIETKLIHNISDLLEYYKSSAHKWKLIPHLCLEADGRSGFLDKWAYCYSFGYYRLEYIKHNYYVYAVDCHTGDVVWLFDETIVDPTINDVNLLNCIVDVEELIVFLQAEAKKAKHPAVGKINREKIRQSRNLGVIFDRNTFIPAKQNYSFW